jgi:hypothetical protein
VGQVRRELVHEVESGLGALVKRTKLNHQCVLDVLDTRTEIALTLEMPEDGAAEVELDTLDVSLDFRVDLGTKRRYFGALLKEASDSRLDHPHHVLQRSLNGDVLVDGDDSDKVMAISGTLLVVERIDVVGP